MIYDCILYAGEKDLLEIRLNEMLLCDDFVTTVIVESNKTHTGQDKPLYFEQHKGELRFNMFYLTVEDMPENATPRERETHQRNKIMTALKFLQPKDDDTIIISDVDEVPRAKSVNLFLESGFNFAALLQNKYAYYLTWLESENSWDRIRIMKYFYLKDKTPEEVRNSGYDISINHAGWHFSWLHNMAKEKLESFSHQELNTEENKRLLDKRHPFWTDEDIQYKKIDLSYPRWVFENQDKLKHIIN